MRFVDSRCIHCGATLRVAGDATHVRCQYCDSEVHIVRERTVVTDGLSTRHADEKSRNLDVLRIQTEIERVDREWTMQYGAQHEPGKPTTGPLAAVFIGSILIVVGLCFGTLWVSVTLEFAPLFFTLFGALVSLLFVFFGVYAMIGAKSMAAAKARYDFARRRLLEDLAHAQRGIQTAGS